MEKYRHHWDRIPKLTCRSSSLIVESIIDRYVLVGFCNLPQQHCTNLNQQIKH